MKLLKIALPVLLVTSACKKDGEDTDPPSVLCPISPVNVPVTVTDLDGNPLPGEPIVEITTINPLNPDGFDPNQPITVDTPCTGGGTSWVCEAYPGDDSNQVTATFFPNYQPAAAPALVDGADCESVTVELRLPPMQN